MLLLLLFHFLLFCMRMSMSVCDLVHQDLNASPILYHIYICLILKMILYCGLRIKLLGSLLIYYLLRWRRPEFDSFLKEDLLLG